MIALRVFQLACAAIAATLAAREVPRPDPLSFTLSVIGERERADGSWEGVDLLASNEPVDRFQVVLTPGANVRATIEADGERVHPSALERPPVLEAWQATAFPGPRTFFEVAGSAAVRIVVSPEERGDRELDSVRATPSTAAATRVFRLTDGAPARVSERRFEGRGAVFVELGISGRR